MDTVNLKGWKVLPLGSRETGGSSAASIRLSGDFYDHESEIPNRLYGGKTYCPSIKARIGDYLSNSTYGTVTITGMDLRLPSMPASLDYSRASNVQPVSPVRSKNMLASPLRETGPPP
ncbi:hypothetical protein CEXT_380831 [Caerostris extrusa]|uniref:Uncharacterized protein n=1 Tax=Caerostris extrusa TaxID=172846 RepID=A0AAV4UB27_CAEEX|nr:hypothetical protein CEXT_380831 [Caerostris extrusa]